MEIRCPYCEKTVQVPGGGQFTCPSCRAVFAVDLEPPKPAGGPPPLPAGGPPPLPGSGPAPLSKSDATVPGGPPPFPGAGPPPVMAPAGPVCARHPGVGASEVCKRCGNFMCPTCATPFRDGNRYCPDCMVFIAGGVGGGPGNIPWETERQTAGMFSSWWKTAKACMFGPDQFFREMSPVGGLEQPLGFNVLGVTVFGLISQVIVFGALAVIAVAAGGGRQASGMLIQLPFQFICSLFMLPVAAAIGVFVTSAIYHVVGMICGGSGTFETTVRIVGYGMGSTSVLSVVPYLGPLVAFFWNIAIVYYGFLHGHRMSSGRALVVALFPVLLSLCCAGILLVVFGGAILAAIQKQGGGGF